MGWVGRGPRGRGLSALAERPRSQRCACVVFLFRDHVRPVKVFRVPCFRALEAFIVCAPFFDGNQTFFTNSNVPRAWSRSPLALYPRLEQPRRPIKTPSRHSSLSNGLVRLAPSYTMSH